MGLLFVHYRNGKEHERNPADYLDQLFVSMVVVLTVLASASGRFSPGTGIIKAVC